MFISLHEYQYKVRYPIACMSCMQLRFGAVSYLNLPLHQCKAVVTITYDR